jgi:adenine-specific DNA methylase
MNKQNVKNFESQRISLAEEYARALGFTQVIIFGHSQECGTVVTTWGIDAERSAQAAFGANQIKSKWGWPEDTLVESQKVKALLDHIDELERQIQRLTEDLAGEDL